MLIIPGRILFHGQLLDILDGSLDNEHIDWTNTSESLVTSGSGTFASLTLDDGGQDYITRVNTTHSGIAYSIQSQTSGSASRVALFTKDGDGTDANLFRIWGTGVPTASISGKHTLLIGWLNAGNYIMTAGSGTGFTGNFIFSNAGNQNQFVLENDGHTYLGAGDLYFSGSGTGLPYGSLYFHESSTTINLVQNNYVLIAGWATGLLNAVITSGGGFEVNNPGVYKIDWAMSVDPASVCDIEIDIFIDGVEQSDGSARRKFGTANDMGSLSGTAILAIATDEVVDLRAKNITNSNDMDIFNANFNIVMVGGT